MKYQCFCRTFYKVLRKIKLKLEGLFGEVITPLQKGNFNPFVLFKLKPFFQTAQLSILFLRRPKQTKVLKPNKSKTKCFQLCPLCRFFSINGKICCEKCKVNNGLTRTNRYFHSLDAVVHFMYNVFMNN